MSKTQTSNYKSFNREDLIEYYHELLNYYSQPNDDEFVNKLQLLNTTDRAIFVLFIACDYRYGILSRMLCTNIRYGKQLIENIKNKLLEI